MLKRLDYEPPALTEVFERYKSEENLKEGHASNRKGKEAEARVLTAMELITTEYAWLQACRLATAAEDSRGIDVVAQTAIGPLYIQVKSSRNGVRQYKRKRRKARVVVIVVDPDMPNTKVMEKVRGALCALRVHILQLRRRSARKRKAQLS